MLKLKFLAKGLCQFSERCHPWTPKPMHFYRNTVLSSVWDSRLPLKTLWASLKYVCVRTYMWWVMCLSMWKAKGKGHMSGRGLCLWGCLIYMGEGFSMLTVLGVTLWGYLLTSPTFPLLSPSPFSFLGGSHALAFLPDSLSFSLWSSVQFYNLSSKQWQQILPDDKHVLSTDIVVIGKTKNDWFRSSKKNDK